MVINLQAGVNIYEANSRFSLSCLPNSDVGRFTRVDGGSSHYG